MSENLNLNDLENVSGGNDGMGSVSYKIYTVKDGDNLWNIAQANKTTIQKIYYFADNQKVFKEWAAKFNKKCATDEEYMSSIWPGMQLKIPV